jgi:hypothetical protein
MVKSLYSPLQGGIRPPSSLPQAEALLELMNIPLNQCNNMDTRDCLYLHTIDTTKDWCQKDQPHLPRYLILGVTTRSLKNRRTEYIYMSKPVTKRIATRCYSLTLIN